MKTNQENSKELVEPEIYQVQIYSTVKTDDDDDNDDDFNFNLEDLDVRRC